MPTFPSVRGLRTSTREHQIVIIDGPNMSNLGARNKRVYGAISSLAEFSPSATGVMMGLRQYSYCAAILSLAMALDDQTFLGAELSA